MNGAPVMNRSAEAVRRVSAADPDAADAPRIAVPEALLLPDTAVAVIVVGGVAGVRRVIARRVIARAPARTIYIAGTRSVVIPRGPCAAPDGAAVNSRRGARAGTAP